MTPTTTTPMQHNAHRNTYTTSLTTRHRLREAARAAIHYAQGDYPACQSLCYTIIQARPAEAILARSHAYLAMKLVGPSYAAGRAYHAACAVRAWEAVVERTGVSRFPVEEARVGLEIARGLLEVAEKQVAEEVEGEVDRVL